MIMSGIILIVAGILEIAAKKDFFQPKIPEKQKLNGKKSEEINTEKIDK